MKKEHLMWLLGGVAIAGVIAYFIITPPKPGVYDTFAQCLEDEGAIFYGAFWCPHCNEQKALFGRSAKELPYVECSTPNGQGQLEVCTEEGITGYPTWEFADGERKGGVLELEELAEKTGCELPNV